MIDRESQLQDAERLTHAWVHPHARGNGNGEPTSELLTRRMSSRRKRLRDSPAYFEAQVSSLMAHNVVSVRPDMSVEGVTTLLLERNLSAVPVITEDGKLIGVVSATDLLSEVQDRGDEEERIPLRVPRDGGVQMELEGGFHATCLARATVEEIMTPLGVTLSGTASVAQAAALMTSKGVGHLSVVSSRGKAIGVLTALDVMRWLAEQSGLMLPPAARARC